MLAQQPGEPHRVLDRPAAVGPVGAGDPDDQRQGGGYGGPHRVHDLEQQPDPVLEGAAVRVLAVVRERREELVQQVAVRGVQLDQVEARRDRPAGRGREGLDDLGDAVARSSSAGSSRSPGKPSGDGATGRQPPASSATAPRPSHGTWLDALRPACASWMPARAPWPCRKSTIGAHSACCWSFQMPVSAGEIRPSGSTAVASVSTSPAPPRASDPRCTRCHWSGTPSRAEYWHIGETHTRLRISRSRRRIGVNSWLMRRGAPCGRGRDLSRPQHRGRPLYFAGASWEAGPTRDRAEPGPTRAAEETPVQRAQRRRRTARRAVCQ